MVYVIWGVLWVFLFSLKMSSRIDCFETILRIWMTVSE